MGTSQSLEYSPSPPRRRWWLILIVLAIPLAMIVGVYQATEISHRIRHPGNKCVVTLCFVDSITGLPLANLLDYSESTNESSNDVATEGDLSAMKVTWTDRDDLTIRIAAQGYTPTAIPLNSRSPARMTVLLVRK